jgi:hypothetical protein
MTMEEFEEVVLGSPPDGWTLGHATVDVLGRRKSVEAWRRGAFAVHQVNCESGKGRLTHAPTGLLIWTCESMDHAAELAERIENLTDWSAINKMIPCGSDLFLKVREIADQI